MSVDGSAAAPGDYLSTNGVLTFAPGETRQTEPLGPSYSK
jgi:hypothetical protein